MTTPTHEDWKSALETLLDKGHYRLGDPELTGISKLWDTAHRLAAERAEKEGEEGSDD